MATIYARWIREGKLYKGHPMTLDDVAPWCREAVGQLLEAEETATE